ncbi:hypothetical protein EGW08_015578 [Elysia chlorotica]|uniref:TNFR-Cys domain-containing protein n=1 Tax=Elysia chlorotica TaxID=188477 RepID=A0A433T583_ELYCH|nr:hypothetical protein EGW08_015578 [Elysia chlorotica]
MIHILKGTLLLFLQIIKRVYSLTDIGLDLSLNSSGTDLNISSPSVNNCTFSQSQFHDQKTWGPECEFACNCKNNDWCLSTGFCPSGCKDGWTRFDKSSPCFQRIERGAVSATKRSSENEHNDAYKKFSFSKFYAMLTSDDEEEQQASDVSKRLVVSLSFASEIKCVPINGSLEISWTAKTERLYAISYIYILFHSNCPKYPKFLTVRSIYSVYPESADHYVPLHNSPNNDEKMYFKEYNVPLLFNELHISFTVNTTVGCPEIQGSGVTVIYGIPICPYRRWGLNCELRCKCPCDVPDCHPVTGSCSRHLVFCPIERYGRYCEKPCSSQCSTQGHKNKELHQRRECHVSSGFCRSCPSLHLEGQQCESPIDPDEIRAIYSACKNATQGAGARGIMDEKWLLEGEGPHSIGVSAENVYRGQVALLVLLVCVATFLIGFGLYVSCVRYLARKRLRKHMKTLERQRILRTSIKSWSGLKDEFRTMHRAGSSTDGQRSATTTIPRSEKSEKSERSERSESSVDPTRLSRVLVSHPCETSVSGADVPTRQSLRTIMAKRLSMNTKRVSFKN